MFHGLRVAILPGFRLFLLGCCSGSPSELAIVKFKVPKEGCVSWKGSPDDLLVFQRVRERGVSSKSEAPNGVSGSYFWPTITQKVACQVIKPP